MSSDINQSEELKRDSRGRFAGGTPPAGFNVNPQNRGDGSWKKEMSFGYQYRRFMNMTVEELEEWNKNTSKKERTVVEDLVFRRVLEAKDSLPDIKEITDRTEGKPKQAITWDGHMNVNRFDDFTEEEIEKAKQALLKSEKTRKSKK